MLFVPPSVCSGVLFSGIDPDAAVVLRSTCFQAARPDLEFEDTVMGSSAVFTRDAAHRVKVVCGYLSASGSRRSAVLGTAALALLTDWVEDRDDNGWAGWKSGRRGAES